MDGFKLRKGARVRGPAVKGNNGGGAFNTPRTECHNCDRSLRHDSVTWLVRRVSTGEFFYGNTRFRAWTMTQDNGGVFPFCAVCAQTLSRG